MNKIILDLCGGTGSWSRPWALNGYDVRAMTPPGFAWAFYEANKYEKIEYKNELYCRST